MGKYFGTDGFRGEANVQLTVDNAFKVGRYVGWYYGRDHKAKIEPTADMAEVAIKAVEAVFDWRAYLKTEFNLDIPYENKENGDLSAASAQSESGDSEERTGNVPETGAAQ